ncbi:MAG TPA: phage tail tape measure protein, partial [Acidimicrobiia bacterium]
MARRTSVIQVMITGDSRDLQRATNQGVSGFRVLGGAALAASKVIASAASAIAGFSIREFAKFDGAMTKSTAIMGDLSDTMRKDLSNAAREVAKTTTFSAEQSAESFFFLASAGLDAEQSIAALPKVAAFAQAGAFDMARATDLLTDAQSALGLSVDDTSENMANMARVSDVLIKANTLANATAEQFSEALTNKAGAALRVLGKDVEEGAAVLAFFADQGVKGAT